MISEVYDALIAAGAPEDKARRAAEVLTKAETRFSKIEADLLVLKWMVGVNTAVSFAIAARLFLH